MEMKMTTLCYLERDSAYLMLDEIMKWMAKSISNRCYKVASVAGLKKVITNVLYTK